MKDVGKYMINMVLLGSLAVIDFKKKEIHIFILLPVIAVWLGISIWNNNVDLFGIISAVFLVSVSLVTRQVFGMADAIVLSLIGIENGVMYMMIIFFISDLLFLLFAVIKFGLKQRHKELPFIPFIFTAFILTKILLMEII